MTEPTASEATILRYREIGEHGVSPHEFRRAVATLTAIAPGAYADLADLTAESAHLLRATAILDRLSGVAASHSTALALWGLPVLTAHLETVHVSPTIRRSGRPRSRPRYRMHATLVPDASLAERAGVPVTDPVRTVLDCARLWSADWGVVAADAALHRGLIDPLELAQGAREVRRLTGAARARAVPGLASGLSESPGESLLRMRLIRMGLSPAEQVVIGSARVDFLVDDELVIEFDGRAKYELNGDPAGAHWAEKQRNDGLSERGKSLVHVTWTELWDEPRLRRRINTALRRLAQRRAS